MRLWHTMGDSFLSSRWTPDDDDSAELSVCETLESPLAAGLRPAGHPVHVHEVVALLLEGLMEGLDAVVAAVVAVERVAVVLVWVGLLQALKMFFHILTSHKTISLRQFQQKIEQLTFTEMKLTSCMALLIE